MFQLKEMYLESCRLAGVSPEDVPEVSEVLERLEKLEEAEGDISSESEVADDDAEGKPLELDPDLPEDDDWDDEDDDDSYGGRGIVYGGSDN